MSRLEVTAFVKPQCVLRSESHRDDAQDEVAVSGDGYKCQRILTCVFKNDS